MFGDRGSPLVEKLVATDNAIKVCARSEPENRRQNLIRAIGYDLVHVTFPDTKGGTELSINLQRDLCDPLDIPAKAADGPASILIVGDITLDWVPIRVTVDFSLETYSGTAKVEKREP